MRVDTVIEAAEVEFAAQQIVEPKAPREDGEDSRLGCEKAGLLFMWL